ncbi:MAG TPA: hypothetical protein PKI20_12680 [Verrucomicrobiota bacterium]|jgi:hypothetical protein|nr:hypothetical protein [Verrucomicrobiota bacterium]HQL78530.1 hypothetical protein [Verrucomicrobiota bacterium]
MVKRECDEQPVPSEPPLVPGANCRRQIEPAPPNQARGAGHPQLKRGLGRWGLVLLVAGLGGLITSLPGIVLVFFPARHPAAAR